MLKATRVTAVAQNIKIYFVLAFRALKLNG